jgi:hypothetical protein
MKRTRRLWLVLVSCLAMACEEGDPGPADAALLRDVAVGGAEAEGEAVCKTFGTGLSPGEFAARTDPAGRCAASSDQLALCSRDVNMVSRSCGVSCYVTNPMATEPELRECALRCLSGQVPSGDECLGCFAQTVACTLAGGRCVGPCSLDPLASACVQCQSAAGCQTALASCSGLPLPPAFLPDAGVAEPDAGAPQEDAGEQEPVAEDASDDYP